MPAPQARPEAFLAEHALELYEAMKRRGDIAVLEATPHLGAVTWARRGPSYSCWEFVRTFCHLANEATGADRVLGQFGKVELDGVQIKRGVDLLRCWALLENAGHLWGTFATERIVLDALRESPAGTELLLAAVPESARARAERILQSYAIYDVHLVFAAAFAAQAHGRGSAKSAKLWGGMASALLSPGSYDLKVQRLHEIYCHLKRLAYLPLDLHESRLSVQLDLVAIRENVLKHVDQLTTPQTSALGAMLTTIQGYVRREIYLSPDVVLLHSLLRTRAVARVAEVVASASSMESLIRVLMAMRGESEWKSDVSAVIETDRQSFIPFHRIVIHRSSTTSLGEVLGRIPSLTSQIAEADSSSCRTNVVPGADGGEIFIDYFVAPRAGPGELATATRAVARTLLDCVGEGLDTSSDADLEGRSAVRSLVEALIRPWLQVNQRIHVRDHEEVPANASCCLLGPGGGDHLRAVLSEATDRTDSRARSLRYDSEAAQRARGRVCELRMLAEALTRWPSPGLRIVMINGFEVVKSWTDSHGVGDFDGAFIDLHEKGLQLHLLEAKSRRTAEEAWALASAELASKLGRLGWVTSSGIQPLERGAMVSLLMSHDVPWSQSHRGTGGPTG